MKPRSVQRKHFLIVLAGLIGIFISYQPCQADPSKYPQFAQQSLPEHVTPSFLSVDQLAEEIGAGKKPLIVDVRTTEEYREVHILSAVSAPLAEFKSYAESIPKDRLVVLY
jgi:hypothetical protein